MSDLKEGTIPRLPTLGMPIASPKVGRGRGHKHTISKNTTTTPFAASSGIYYYQTTPATPDIEQYQIAETNHCVDSEEAW